MVSGPKVLLIEELESHLYPTLHKELQGLVSLITTQNKIQVFMTSNSEQVIKHFPKVSGEEGMDNYMMCDNNVQDDIFVLLYPLPSHHIGRHSWLLSAVKQHLLNIEAEKPLIVCEADDDIFFVMTIAGLAGVSLEGVQFHSSASLCSSPELKVAFETIVEKITSLSAVRFLRDMDFRVGLVVDKREYFWDLPSIESYIFVDYCMNHRADEVSPLAFLFGEHANTFATAYVNSFRSQNREDARLADMLTTWGAAVTAASQIPVTQEAIIAVAKVTRGHNWVKDIMHSSTSSLIAGLTTSILQHNPSLRSQIEAVIKYACLPFSPPPRLRFSFLLSPSSLPFSFPL